MLVSNQARLCLGTDNARNFIDFSYSCVCDVEQIIRSSGVDGSRSSVFVCWVRAQLLETIMEAIVSLLRFRGILSQYQKKEYDLKLIILTEDR